jgi:hypothetical protein
LFEKKAPSKRWLSDTGRDKRFVRRNEERHFGEVADVADRFRKTLASMRKRKSVGAGRSRRPGRRVRANAKQKFNGEGLSDVMDGFYDSFNSLAARAPNQLHARRLYPFVSGDRAYHVDYPTGDRAPDGGVKL